MKSLTKNITALILLAVLAMPMAHALSCDEEGDAWRDAISGRPDCEPPAATTGSNMSAWDLAKRTTRDVFGAMTYWMYGAGSMLVGWPYPPKWFR